MLTFILIVLVVNLLVGKWLIADQRKHAQKLALPNGGWVETPSIKAICFIITFVTFQGQCLPVIYKAIQANEYLKNIKRGGVPTGAGISTSINVDSGGVKIKTELLTDADYMLKFSDYKVGQYSIPVESKCMKEIEQFASKFTACVLPIIDSGAIITVQITGQADGIRCTKNSIYRGTSDIPRFNCFSLATDQYYYASYVSNRTVLRNEDYARLRAYEAYKILYVQFGSINTRFNLRSDVTKVVGKSQRWVTIEIYIPDAFKKEYEKYNSFEKKIFNFFVNA